jgi:hypothetical protein
MTITQDTSAPLVVVCGSTGVQGGSVIKGLVESDRPYRFRGLTRDPSKPSARKLADQGVEIFSVSLTVGNESEVRKAFEGANIIFVGLSRYLYYFGQTSNLDFKVVTNFWEHMNMQRVGLIYFISPRSLIFEIRRPTRG